MVEKKITRPLYFLPQNPKTPNMIAELGHFALILALAISLAQIPLCATPQNHAQFHKITAIAKRAQIAQTSLIAASFLALAYAFLQSDFSLTLVTLHSHSTKPTPYKIAALWGNHEGSLLLWILFLSLCAIPLARKKQNSPVIAARTLAFQNAIISSFLAFSLFASNPFARLASPPLQGLGLNPILQDPALAIHPPILYAGYVGSSIAFSLALALLSAPKAQDIQIWAGTLRIYAQAAWTLLTAGVALGAWWAYRELGWGGFWFWDPVENAALMPWLLATALLHAVIMTERRRAALFWTMLLAILTFSLSIFGTFLTRSGILVSVHSFASDPDRGLFILAILALALCGALAFLALRWNRLAPDPDAAPFHLISRETAISANSLFLSCGCAVVLIGTLYPAIMQAAGFEPISVGPPYFHRAFLPLMIPLILLMPIAPFLSWQRARATDALRRLAAAALAALAALLLFLAFTEPAMILPSIGAGAGVWIIAGALSRIMDAPPRDRPRHAPMALAHAGFGLFIMGAVATTAAQREHLVNMAPGETTRFAGYAIHFGELRSVQGRDYHAWRAEILLKDEAEASAEPPLRALYPELRDYIARATTTHEASIATFWLPAADFHAVLGEENDPAPDATEETTRRRKIKFYFNPLAPLIWLGAILMSAGGLAAALRRRAGA